MADTIANKVAFELVSPQKLLKSQDVEMVVVPCSEGDIGVLPGHAPLIATVRSGVVDIYANGKVAEKIFVSGGFTEVTPERCTLLAEEAILLADIDVAAAQARLSEARTAVESAQDDGDAKTAAEARLAVAEALLAAVGGAGAAHA